jgi:UDP-N-acetylglucosamine:LPS N-acetylglucosamine transferase
MKIAVLSINAGGGHIAAMHSLAQMLIDVPGDNQITEHICEKENVEKLHKFLTDKVPYVYEAMYNLGKLPLPSLLNTIRVSIAARINKLDNDLEKFLDDTKYDIVFSTHFLLTEQLLRLKIKHKSKVKIINYVPDFDHLLIHVVRYKGHFCDGYIVQSEKLKEKINQMAPTTPCIIGKFNVHEEFKNAKRISKVESARKLQSGVKISLEPEKKIIVVNGGALWTSKLIPKLKKLFSEYTEVFENFHFLVVTGRNKSVFNKFVRLEKEFATVSVIPLPFLNYEQMACVYRISDMALLASLAPATMYELISMEVAPIIVARINPGQEYFNLEYAKENNLVMHVPDTKEFAETVRKFASDSEAYKEARDESLNSFKKEIDSRSGFEKDLSKLVEILSK